MPTETRSATVSRDAVAQAIRAAIRDHQLTQVRVGRLLGMSQPAVHRRIWGQVEWSLAEVRALARAMGCTVDELIAYPPNLDLIASGASE